MEIAVEMWFGEQNGCETSKKGESGASPYASKTNRIWERRLVLHSKDPVSECYRISFTLDAVATSKDQQSGGRRKSRPRVQVTSLQPCVDLRQACSTPTELWKDASKLGLRTVDTAGVSPSLDRLLYAHAGVGKGGETSMLHEAPSEVVAFGAVYGISCNSVWGYTAKNWDRLAKLAGDWLERALERHESGRTSTRECASKRFEPLTVLIFGKTSGSKYWELAVAETFGEVSPSTESAYSFRRLAAGRRARRAIAGSMIEPSISDAKRAHSENLWPCSVMCTLHYQRRPTSENPRLVVFLYSDKWMIYDRYGQAEGDVAPLGAVSEPVAPSHDRTSTSSARTRARLVAEMRQARPGPAEAVDFLDDAEEERLIKEANLQTYEEFNLRREENRAQLEAEMDRPLEFSISHTLRTEWMACQKKDPDCLEILRSWTDGRTRSPLRLTRVWHLG